MGRSVAVYSPALKIRLISTSVPATAISERDQDLKPCSTLITPPKPSVAFNLKDPTLREVQKVVKAARSSGGGGKWHSSGHMQRMSGFLRRRSNIEQFRVISLLSMEGKIFFSIDA